MRNRKRSQLAAPNSNAKAMPPPSNPNMKLMPPPSHTRIPNVRLPDSQDTSSAKTTLPPRSSSCRDILEDDHSSRESNLQLVVAPEPQARFPMKILDAMGPFPLGANLQEPPSNPCVDGNQNLGQLQPYEVQLPSNQFSKGKEKEKETPYEDADQFSGKGLGDNSRGNLRLLIP